MEKEKEKQKTKKQYILIKNTDKTDLLKIKESFGDPNKYLLNQKKIIIGNKNFFSKKRSQSALKLNYQPLLNPPSNSPLNNNINNSKKILYINSAQRKKINSKSKSFTSNDIKNKNQLNEKIIRKINRINNYKEKQKKKYYYKTYLNNLENTNELREAGIHYKIKSLGDVLNIYEKFKNMEDKNKIKGKIIDLGNKKIPNEIIEEVKKNLSSQENILNHQQKLKNKSDLFSKLLSKKLKRKENDLLYNKIEEYRLKRQLIDLMEVSKTCQEKFGANYWVADLRRPKTHSDIRYIYSNTNKELPPDRIIDFPDKDIEFINDPNLQDINFSELLKNINIFRKTHKFNFPNIEKMSQIGVIEGKNLLSQEISNIQKKENINNIKYKVYNNPKELNKKNTNELIYKESYDIKYHIQRNRSYTNEENKNQNLNENKNSERRALYRAQSQIDGLNIKNKNKNKKKYSYLNEALNLLKKENKQRDSSIKIISRK